MGTPYELLLTEPESHRVLLAVINYHDGATTQTYYAATLAWTTEPDETPASENFKVGLSDLNSSVAIDEGETYGGVAGPEAGTLEILNTDRRFDDWRGYRVEGFDVTLLMVGTLKDGTKVTYTDAAASPLMRGQGVGKPSVNDQVMTIAFNGALYQLRRKLNTKLFSPPCLSFPGTSAGNVDFGDSFDASGAFSRGFWIFSYDPTRTGQIIFSKDTGAAGYYLDLGTAGAGALRFGIRNQTSATTDTAAGVILINHWHHVQPTWDPATSTRTILVDGVSVASTAGVAGGSPGGNSASFKVGTSFYGLISKGSGWSIAQTPTQARADIFLPLLGTETNLDALPLMQEGKGATTADNKSGSVITGTLGTGVLWATSGWCGSSLAGKRWPQVIGKALRVPMTPIDPALSIFATCWPPPVAAPVPYSNHNPVAGAAYTYEAARGLITLTGAATGTYSADLPGEDVFTGAVEYDGATGYASGTVTCPAGSMSITGLVRPDTFNATQRNIAGWHPSGGVAGVRQLGFLTTGTNAVAFFVSNDAGTVFVASITLSVVSRWYQITGALDMTASQIRVYVDGALSATTAVTGTFATTVTSFAVARRSASSTLFFPGSVDDLRVFSRALVVADAENLTVHPDAVDTTNETQHWRCDTGSGASLVNSVGGGATLTLTGTAGTNYTWTQSRIAPADGIVLALTRYTDYHIADLDIPALAAYIRQTSADSGWMVDDDQTVLDFADRWLKGVHSYLRPSVSTGLLQMGQVALPSDTPDTGADFDDGDMPRDSVIEPADDRIAPPAYGVDVLWGRNWSPQDASQLAGILTTQPALYQFGIKAWRSALWPDWQVLDDYPQAEIVPSGGLESPLLNEADANADSVRVLPFYSPDRESYVFPLLTPALTLEVAGEMRVTCETADNPPEPVLGMESPGRSFTVLSVTRTGEEVSVRGLS